MGKHISLLIILNDVVKKDRSIMKNKIIAVLMATALFLSVGCSTVSPVQNENGIEDVPTTGDGGGGDVTETGNG
tara:strand:- start:91 stop:312 length:222 start_codon:yes stop_codon:yes gene_type:complete